MICGLKFSPFSSSIWLFLNYERILKTTASFSSLFHIIMRSYFQRPNNQEDQGNPSFLDGLSPFMSDMRDPPNQREEMVLVWGGLGSLIQVCSTKDDLSQLLQFGDVPWSPPFQVFVWQRYHLISSLSLCCCWGFSSLLCLPSSTYPEIFNPKFHLASKPIASLICREILKYSTRILVFLWIQNEIWVKNQKLKFFSNLILFIILMFHPKFVRLITSFIHSFLHWKLDLLGSDIYTCCRMLLKFKCVSNSNSKKNL